ncbi:hypothetical protein ACOMHN_055867 [Nucella lapillus]
MNDKHTRDWSRLRRAERRSQSARHDIDVMHADIIQLRQHVIEINSRLNRLDDLTSDLQLEVTKVTHDQGSLREEVGRVKAAQGVAGDALRGLRKNVSLTDAWRIQAQHRVEQLQTWTQEMQKSQHHVLSSLQHLQTRVTPAPSPPRTTGRTVQTSSLQHDPGMGSGKHPDSRQPLSGALPDMAAPEGVRGEGGRFHNRPQRDQSADVRGGEEGLTTVMSVEGGQNDVNMSGDRELEQDTGGSGEGDEFFIVEDPYLKHHHHNNQQQTGEEEEEEEEEEEGETSPTPTTPLTTSTVPTLTHPTLTLPTPPLPSNCPSLTEFVLLRQRVDDLDSLVQTWLPANRTILELNNRTEQLEAMSDKQDEQLQQVHGVHGPSAGVTGNFTCKVVTLDQWHTASQQMLNATERTQRRLAALESRVTDNAQMTSDLHLTSEEQRAMAQRQYRTLQTYVIQLNNSLQDLTERVDILDPSKSHPGRPPYGPYSGSSSKRRQQGAAMTSRLDNLALQLVYSENRLSHLETQVLNSSLNSCRKTNSDLYQDASLLRVDKQMSQAQRDIVTLKDTVKRLDLGLYRLHGNSKGTQEALRKVTGQVNDMAHTASKVEALKSEVDNLLFQMPVDCNDYYQRGYRKSGEFIIHPRGADHSLKVHCVMQLHDHHDDHDGDRGRGEGDGGRRRREGPWREEEGGWTVIHQRSSGQVNFTRSWAEYAEGFGTPRSEYWLGNEHVHLLTSHRNYTLLITLTDIFGGNWYAAYRPFSLSGKGDNYRLSLGRYQGNATDTLRYASGMSFSTWDRDTDGSSSPCARYNGGGWWYSHCQTSNLNGPYDVGMIWFHKDWRDWLQLRHAAIMVRPLS